MSARLWCCSVVLLCSVQLPSWLRRYVWTTRRSNLRSGTRPVRSATTAWPPCTTEGRRRPSWSTTSPTRWAGRPRPLRTRSSEFHINVTTREQRGFLSFFYRCRAKNRSLFLRLDRWVTFQHRCHYKHIILHLVHWLWEAHIWLFKFKTSFLFGLFIEKWLSKKYLMATFKKKLLFLRFHLFFLLTGIVCWFWFSDELFFRNVYFSFYVSTIKITASSTDVNLVY